MEASSSSSEEEIFDNAEIRGEDIANEMEDDILPLDIEENEQEIETEGSDLEREENFKGPVLISFDAKLRELLRNICSTEVKICSEASKEFVNLLKGDSGGELLRQYVMASPSCMELMEAWRLRQGKPGMAFICSLISEALNHPDGKYCMDDLGRLTISRRLDKFARSILETKLEDVYRELASKEAKRQRASLLLMASVVRRGVGLASEVAKCFNFKLPVFPKLSEIQERKGGGEKTKYGTRPSFIEFAMSFLEVGNPRLLRWILQQKDMYFGVLRRLGTDEDATIIYVLSTLRDKVLTPDSLVPPGLRSVLFGSVTLEQLSSISGYPAGGPAAEVAHEILIMVCTDPGHGLMPDSKVHASPLRGNPTRLLELMKKLKATEIGYHRDLLLAIVAGRPSLGSVYMDEFPYLLEPRASPLWFSAISLASDLISSVNGSFSFNSVASTLRDPPQVDCLEVQCLLKCIVPRSFTRLVINRGLLHSEILVRHGSLRLLLEALKSLQTLISAVNDAVPNMNERNPMITSKINSLPKIGERENFNKCLDSGKVQKWLSLKQEIQDEVRAMLPDPQVLLKLLSTMSCGCSTKLGKNLKRERAVSPSLHFSDVVKKRKSNSNDGNIDILIGGINEELSTVEPPSLTENEDTESDDKKVIAGIWGLSDFSVIGNELKDAEIYFHSKLLDALTFYLRTMPTALEGSFDFFKILPSNPLLISIDQQRSLMNLLVECIGHPFGGRVSIKAPDMMYKHLLPLINLLIFTPDKEIHDQAHVLARAAMLSTGSFDQNISEIDAWFLFLPGYSKDKWLVGSDEAKVLKGLSTVVVSFFCDAVSTMGNNLYKYLDHVRFLFSNLGFEDVPLNFSPLAVCILQKCLRLLDADSGTFKLSERCMISIYVSNTLGFLLMTSVEARPLSALIEVILSEKMLEHFCSREGDSGDIFSEWRPLNNLLLFSRSFLKHQACTSLYSCSGSAKPSMRRSMPSSGHSCLNILRKVKKMIGRGHDDWLNEVGIDSYSEIVCVSPDDLLEDFPLLITTGHHILGQHSSFMSSILFLEFKFLSHVSKCWPDMFISAVEVVGSCSSISEKFKSNKDLDSFDSHVAAFALFLKNAPFSALFPAITCLENPNLLGPTQILDFLRAKFSDCQIEDSSASVHILLFWANHLRSAYRTKTSDKLEWVLKVCFILIEHVFDTTKATGAPVMKLAEFIFHHPVVTGFFSHPLSCNLKHTSESFGDNIEDLICLSKQSIHPIDSHILQLLKRLASYLLSGKNSPLLAHDTNNAAYKSAVEAFRNHVDHATLVFKDKFNLCVGTEDLFPLLSSFYVFQTFMHFISPYELMKLVKWMFHKVDQIDSIGWSTSRRILLSVGFYITEGAFDAFVSCLHDRKREAMPRHLFSEMEYNGLDVNHTFLEDVYYKVIEFATCFKLESAEKCLLKAVNVVYNQRSMHPQSALVPLFMVTSRMIISSSEVILLYLVNKTSKIKGKILYQLTEVSPLHLSLFGQRLLCLMNKDLLLNGEVAEETSNLTLTDEDFMMLLPAALSYLTSSSVKFGKQHVEILGSISLFYSRILLDGFSNWKSFVFTTTFLEEFEESIPESMEKFLGIFGSSLLGKGIHMLRYYFALNGASMKKHKRLKILDSIFENSGVHDGLLDCDVSEICHSSFQQLLNFLNRVIAKISLSRMLLFLQDDALQFMSMESCESTKGVDLKAKSSKIEVAKVRFTNMLVSALDQIVKKVPLTQDDAKNSCGGVNYRFFRFLEFFILKNILQISKEIQIDLIQSYPVSLLEPFIRSCLLHRFEDPTTLRALRSIMISLREVKYSYSQVLELLLAHSQFVPTILWNESVSNSSGHSHHGTLVRPISSILKSNFLPYTDKSEGDNESIHDMRYGRKLEVVKLLRVLFLLKSPQSKDNTNSKELISLFLSGYNATLSEIDMEILNLMCEIESIDRLGQGSMAEMDYLWGNSALKVRKEETLQKFLSSNNMLDCETTEEYRKRRFRENLPVDPRLCVMTIQHFAYDRILWTGPMPLIKLQPESLLDSPKKPVTCLERIQRYDPAFILRFSIHGLFMGYIEPIEFAGLGLLAIAFVSISSPDEGIRKLAYEAIGRFKEALEKCRNGKDGVRLRLLLTHFQNGIVEPWQKIPSLTAIFAAEASLILLNPSHDHYLTISTFLMRSPQVDMKNIPLFHTLFRSSSVHFKTDRSWILRLLYAGLNLDDDAHIVRRKFLLELLLSFYTSSLSDYESKYLIVQIVKKSVKFHMLAWYLVEHCGLLSWLSSVLSTCGENLCGDNKDYFLRKMAATLEVAKDVLAVRSLNEWLQKYALEQLSELSSHLQMLLVGDLKLRSENVALVNSILDILVSTLRISLKRKIYQPHFTLSMEALFQLYQAIDDEFSNTNSNCTAELGLKAILMSTPPILMFHMDSEKLSKFLMWAVSTALESDSMQKAPSFHLSMLSEQQQSEESLISKLVRWLAASVILGRISRESCKISGLFSPKASKLESLQSLLKNISKGAGSIEEDSSRYEALAGTILYLQQLLGMNCGVLPSVVSALHLLLFNGSSSKETVPFDGNINNHTELLWSKIRCPPEVSPAWRWSYYQPWKDLSSELTDLQKIEELHACQTLLIIFSDALCGKTQGLPVLSYLHVEMPGVFTWERDLMVKDCA